MAKKHCDFVLFLVVYDILVLISIYIMITDTFLYKITLTITALFVTLDIVLIRTYCT